MNTITLNRDRLAECRKKLGITKQEAAKRMDMSQPAYVRYESGTRTPAIHVIHTMATVLGTSTAYLTNQSDDPRPDSYVVYSKDDTDLFLFIERYKSADNEAKARLLAYINEFI